MNNTACPLDCYDACSIVADAEKLKGDPHHPLTKGYLCPHLNHYDEHERITEARYKGESVSLETALEHLEEMLESTPSHRTLLLRGRGNFALMQGVSEHFFASRGARLCGGSLCDGAGQAGIEAGRGSNRLVDPAQLEHSEVVIVWGRNIHVTNSHYLPLLRSKTVIVIDPVRTQLAKSAALHVAIKPRGDLYLALLLARFAIIEGLQDPQLTQQRPDALQEFYELTQTIRIKATLEKIDVSLGQIGAILELIRGKKTMILVGTGVQKYRSGAEVLRAIDSFAAVMGYFGKEGCGVNFLGDSMQGLTSPFESRAKRVSIGNIDFTGFDLLFIQGANPLSQLPDTNRVEHLMGSVANVIYFGLYENESSARADLVIPAQSFLEKEDIRSSYGYHGLLRMHAQCEAEGGIGEYALFARLCARFGVALRSEAEYLAFFESQRALVEARAAIPYTQGFDTDDGAFAFLEECEADAPDDEGLCLITCKSPRSLNSQFSRDHRVYLHPSHGFLPGQRVRVSSERGSVELDVAHDANLRHDCVLIYSGTPGVNRLSSSQLSYEGQCAAYQELHVKVEAC
ncbi:MAG: molybdopterin-dependent oxidoreductase [Campylobacterales bacterium]|nr:molybdopterin-dependent oxidoreductase [Campylobacterales bacterium]